MHYIETTINKMYLILKNDKGQTIWIFNIMQCIETTIDKMYLILKNDMGLMIWIFNF